MLGLWSSGVLFPWWYSFLFLKMFFWHTKLPWLFCLRVVVQSRVCRRPPWTTSEPRTFFAIFSTVLFPINWTTTQIHFTVRTLFYWSVLSTGSLAHGEPLSRIVATLFKKSKNSNILRLESKKGTRDIGSGWTLTLLFWNQDFLGGKALLVNNKVL